MGRHKRIRTAHLLEGIGSDIPGSKYKRDFCCECKTPIRVSAADLGYKNLCQDCDPDKTRKVIGRFEFTTPRQQPRKTTNGLSYE